MPISEQDIGIVLHCVGQIYGKIHVCIWNVVNKTIFGERFKKYCTENLNTE